MKKFIPFAVAAALAIAPSSAMAVSTWGGWQNQHSDNVVSPNYPATFGNNGLGDSQYCVDPGTSSTHCGNDVLHGGTAVYSPVVFAGVLLAGPAPQGCAHQDAGKAGGNPCTNGDTLGAAYVGLADNNTDPAGSASSPSPVAPGTGVGVQG
jgi:hypothetical protein